MPELILPIFIIVGLAIAFLRPPGNDLTAEQKALDQYINSEGFKDWLEQDHSKDYEAFLEKDTIEWAKKL